MNEEYLRDSMLINIEREYTEGTVIDEVIHKFYTQKIDEYTSNDVSKTSFTFICKLVFVFT